LAIILELNWQFDLRIVFVRTIGLLLQRCDEVLFDRLCAFCRERLGLLLADRGVRYDVSNAVLEVSWANPADALQRCRALTQFRSRGEFEKLILGQKRVANILKGVDLPGDASTHRRVNEKLLQEQAEIALYGSARDLEPELEDAISRQDYAAAFDRLLALRTVIDAFFDRVLVMCPDHELSTNRLVLLAYVKSLFLRVADLSQIVVDDL
jgi:glycyl-tRNA synthetase beta chain